MTRWPDLPGSYTRRRFFGLGAGAAAAAATLFAHRPTPRDAASPDEAVARAPAEASVPKRPPVAPRGEEQRTLLPGTTWATPVTLRHSGIDGSRALILGGVHGNEPGGWLAAEQIAARWAPEAGTIAVVPRANVLAIHALERTLPDLGDLNRLYPGSAQAALPMARMADAIRALATDIGADLLVDMHESWVFYAERSQNGTAYLGQTISAGLGPDAALAQSVARAANERITVARDRMWYREFRSFFRPPPDGAPPQDGDLPVTPTAGTSSLALGQFVPGLTPLLVEMGQQEQPVERRVELHLLVAGAALRLRGVL